MGSSKKKHKEKDREHRHRSKSSFSISKSTSKYGLFANIRNHSMFRSQQMTESTVSDGDNGEQSLMFSPTSVASTALPKPPPLRMVLKVPQSTMLGGQSSAANNGTSTASANNDLPEHSPSVDFLSSLPPHQSHISCNANLAQTGCSPFNLSNASYAAYTGEAGQEREDSSPPLAPLATISLESLSKMHSSGEFSDAIGNTTTEMESSCHHAKKAKKSKKSKKSKHKKHKRHRHFHHHHHSSSSSLMPNISNYQPQQQHLMVPQNISVEGEPSWMSFSTSFTPPLPFNSPTLRDNSLNTSASIESDQVDFFAHLSPGEISAINNNSNNQNLPMTPSDVTELPELNQLMRQCVSSEVVTSTTNMLVNYPINSPLHGPEIKLKLSKNQFTSQYSSTTVTQSSTPDSSFQSQLTTSSPKVQNFSTPPEPPIPSLDESTLPLKENSSFQSSATSSPNKLALFSPPSLSQTTLLTAPSDQTIITSPSKHSTSTSTRQDCNRSRSRSRSEDHKQSSAHSRSRQQKGKPEKGFTDLLLHLLRQIKRKDTQNFFLYPVTDEIAPGYSTLISSPMDITTIQAAIERRKHNQQQPPKYFNLGDFIADVKLMCDNAMKYNHPDTIYYKAASKLWHFTNSKLTKKEALVSYAKTYTKCTPLELSLTASSCQPTNQTLLGQQQQQSSTSTLIQTSAKSSGGSSSNTGFHNSTVLPSFSTDYPAPPTSAPSASSLVVFGQSSSSLPTSNSSALSSTGGFGDVSTGDYSCDDPFSTIDLLSTLSPFRLYDDEENATTAGYAEQFPLYFPDQQYETQPNFFVPTFLPPLVEIKEKKESEMTSEELIASIQETARKASEKLRRYRGVPRISCLSRNPTAESDINSSQVILNTLCTGDVAASSKAISIEHFVSTFAIKEVARPLVTGTVCIDDTTSETRETQSAENGDKEKVTSGKETKDKTAQEAKTEESKQMSELKEKEEDLEKSALAEVNAREKEINKLKQELIPTIYDDDEGLSYALSISRFTRDVDERCPSKRIVPMVLNKLTFNNHKKGLDTFNKLVLLS